MKILRGWVCYGHIKGLSGRDRITVQMLIAFYLFHGGEWLEWRSMGRAVGLEFSAILKLLRLMAVDLMKEILPNLSWRRKLNITTASAFFGFDQRAHCRRRLCGTWKIT